MDEIQELIAVATKPAPSNSHVMLHDEWLVARANAAPRLAKELSRLAAENAELRKYADCFKLLMASAQAMMPHADKPDKVVEALLDKVKENAELLGHVAAVRPLVEAAKEYQKSVRDYVQQPSRRTCEVRDEAAEKLKHEAMKLEVPRG